MSAPAAKSLPELDPERTICFCHNVSCQALQAAIRAGANTHYDIQVATCASTGCGGCEPEVLEILEEELAARKVASGSTSSDR